MSQSSEPDYFSLIPELSSWNNGTGVDPEDWIASVGNYELAIGYSQIFWPRFARYDRYILREGFSAESLRGFEKSTAGDQQSVEAVMNHIHIADIHLRASVTESQLRHLGRVLRDIHEVKLKRDFPDRTFAVSFNDQAGLDLPDYELTFWQSAD